MCSLYSLLRMENYQGDLADIVRAGGGGTAAAYGVSSEPPISSSSSSSDWQQHQFTNCSPSPPDPISFDQPISDGYFGDPFSHLRDPLLHELGMSAGPPGFFGSPSSSELITASSSGPVDETTGASTFGQSVDDMKRPPAPASNNIFSRMLQISPTTAKQPQSGSQLSQASPRGIKGCGLVGSDVINVSSSSKGCLLDNNTALQISSPRNPGIKRRKSQAKQVVCIPAPAAPNSRPSGEVVPSDLWAWRKYGQKPIKGSPYPRGYYRCSSSKGCSARKQVERSRADPNMLVITYTSEHNHPWPTQRNALAGSTRAQPSKNHSNASKCSPAAAGSNHLQNTMSSTTSPKEEQKDHYNSNDNSSASPNVNATAAGSSSTTSASIKEETEDMEKQLDMVNDDDDAEFSTDHHHHHHHHNQHHGFAYRPSMQQPDSNNHHNCDQDFFADLGEIEADPLNLLFSQGFAGEQKGSKGLDPFNLFDWSSSDNTSNNNDNSSAFGEAAKRGL